MMLDEPVNTFRLLGSDTHADVIVVRWGREERCMMARWGNEEGSVDDGGGRLASDIPFFFVNASMCLLSHALVILVTYRDKGLPQLPKPGDFMEWKKRWAPDEPVNAFRLPRSETEADAITKKKKRRRKRKLPRYMYGKPISCRVSGKKEWEFGFLNKNLADLEQGGPR